LAAISGIYANCLIFNFDIKNLLFMTESDLQGILWNKIAFMQEDESRVLLLECQSEEQAKKLLKLLTTNEFILRVIENEKSKTYSFEIEFTNSEYGIRNNLGLTKEQYPQLAWLHNQQVTHITTGYRNGAKKLQFLPDFHPLDSEIKLN